MYYFALKVETVIIILHTLINFDGLIAPVAFPLLCGFMLVQKKFSILKNRIKIDWRNLSSRYEKDFFFNRHLTKKYEISIQFESEHNLYILIQFNIAHLQYLLTYNLQYQHYQSKEALRSNNSNMQWIFKILIIFFLLLSLHFIINNLRGLDGLGPYSGRVSILPTRLSCPMVYYPLGLN